MCCWFLRRRLSAICAGEEYTGDFAETFEVWFFCARFPCLFVMLLRRDESDFGLGYVAEISF